MKFKFQFSFLYFSLLIFQNEICLAQSLLVTLFHQRPNHTKTSVADRADQGFLGKKEPNRPQFRQNLAQNAGNPFAAGPSCFNSAQSKVAWVCSYYVREATSRYPSPRTTVGAILDPPSRPKNPSDHEGIRARRQAPKRASRGHRANPLLHRPTRTPAP